MGPGFRQDDTEYVNAALRRAASLNNLTINSRAQQAHHADITIFGFGVM
jgi:hypothetical protein